MLFPNLFFRSVTVLNLVICILAIYYSISLALSLQISIFLIFFSIVTLFIIVHFSKKSVVLHICLSMFTLLIAWRIAAISEPSLPYYVLYLYGIAFVIKLIYLFWLCYQDLHGRQISSALPIQYMNSAQWQLLFIRMYVGYDLVPHFTEKLFAGVGPRAEVINYFASVKLADPFAFVLLAGLIEFGGAFSISCGFLTRTGSIAFVIYLLTATILGGHFSLGFTWANPGGGWEYPMLWGVLILTFAFFAPYKFSIDMYLQRHYKLPNWIKFFMGHADFSKVK